MGKVRKVGKVGKVGKWGRLRYIFSLISPILLISPIPTNGCMTTPPHLHRTR
jgi:hypothetical protein